MADGKDAGEFYPAATDAAECNTGNLAASKSYNILAAGKPILYIGDDNSEIALCIKEFTLGWIVAPNDPHALKNMIEFIYDNKNNLSSIRNNARTVSDTIFAKDQILERYYTLLK